VPARPHMNILSNKCVFKIKRWPDEFVDRYEARLVTSEFHQQDGLDFTETFSSDVKHTTIRTVITLAIHHHWPIHELDVHNAFLHGFLTEEVYMR